MSTLEDKKRVTREYFDAFVKGDKAWWERNVAPEFRRHDPGLPYEVVGPPGLQLHHDTIMKGVPDLSLPIHTVIGEGDKVLACLRFKGTHTGDMFGYPPTGNSIDVEVFDLFRFGEDGRMVEHWAMVDSLGLLKALGVSKI